MGRIALVTGAGSGIGRAVALALAGSGYSVLLSGRRRELLEEAAQEGGASCVPVVTDVTDAASIAALFREISQRFGRLDLLFNNAGVSAPAVPFEELPLEQWQAVIDTNLTGAFLCAQSAFRFMKQQQPRGGRIINNGSIAAYVPRPRMAPYTASKHAITGLTKTIALEGRPYDIACGQIDIGNTATSLAASVAEGALQADLSMRSEPLFDLTHVADAVRYMAGLPLDANVLFMTVMATKMPYVGRG
jgi:NAD(P)-dependent dehydrogenase (short-subunit alcohol dehydrogenase family)